VKKKLVKSINRVVDELHFLGADNIADGILSDIPEIADIALNKAEQQLFGWHCAHQGERLPSMIRGMGLSVEEWNKLKKSGDVHYLTESEIEDIEDCLGLRVDRSHEECCECALEEVDPAQCKGHVAGPSPCSLFVKVADEKYYEIIGKHTGSVIGVCSGDGVADAKKEDPGATFREITKQKFEQFQ